MKRTPLPPRRTGLRRTPMPRGTAQLARSARIRPVNPERRARLEAEAYGAHAAWIRRQPSAVSGRWGTPGDPIVAAHALRTRGAGGKAHHVIPLLLSEERAFHQHGRDTFAAAYAVDLDALTARYALGSPALDAALGRRLAVLSCAGCGTRSDAVPALLPCGSHVALCADPACRGALSLEV